MTDGCDNLPGLIDHPNLKTTNKNNNDNDEATVSLTNDDGSDGKNNGDAVVENDGDIELEAKGIGNNEEGNPCTSKQSCY